MEFVAIVGASRATCVGGDLGVEVEIEGAGADTETLSRLGSCLVEIFSSGLIIQRQSVKAPGS